jgi:Mg-chelatase subunit ChlD
MRTLALLLAVWCFVCSQALNAQVARFQISQAQAQTGLQSPRIKAYLNILDSNDEPAAGLRGSTVSASMGTHSLTVVSVAPFDPSGEGVAYIFLVDVSGSIGKSQFLQIRAAIVDWLDSVRPLDRVALIAFGDVSRLVVDLTANRSELTAALDGLAPNGRKTQLYTALSQAMNMESAKRSDAGLPSRRVIVVLSDGKDEGSGRTAEDVLSQIRTVHMPIYAVGYSRLPSTERQRYLDVLHRFADNSGGVFREVGGEPLDAIYAEMHRAIRGVWTATFMCPACQADGQRYPLQVTLATPGDHRFSDSLDLVIPPPPVVPTPPSPLWSRWWVLTLAGAVVMSGIALIIVFAVRGGKPEEPQINYVTPQDDYVPAPRQRSGLPVKLLVVRGAHPGHSHELRLAGRAVIGRRNDCDVILDDDDEVSGHHCELALVDGKVLVYDLQSRNGTSVNGVPIVSRYRLESGDAILVGRTELRVSFQEGL